MIVSDLDIFLQESEIEAFMLEHEKSTELYCDPSDDGRSSCTQLGIKLRTEHRTRGSDATLPSLLHSSRYVN